MARARGAWPGLKPARLPNVMGATPVKEARSDNHCPGEQSIDGSSPAFFDLGDGAMI
jgi:hypothetical protein